MQTAQTLLRASNYALGETLSSGQAFRWRAVNGAWEGVIGKRWVRLSSEPTGVRAAVAAPVADWHWLSEYLQTETNLEAVLSTYPKDEHMQRAVAECPGLRLLKQEPWECLASFILSSTKQIVQIQQIVELLCERFGESIRSASGRAYAFPTAEVIAELSETDLRCCKMGFRAPYLRGTAQMIVRGEVDLAAVARLDLEKARAELMRFPGVGRKIADCVLLFAYHFQQAFPVDVWILKALRQLYFPRRRPSPRRLLDFTQTYFGPNAGYAQQYLFHYMRTRVGRAKK
jgi:N-glycosylase/DNA lyase